MSHVLENWSNFSSVKVPQKVFEHVNSMATNMKRMLFTLYLYVENSVSQNKEHITVHLLNKYSQGLARTFRDSKRLAETRRDSQRLAETRRDSQRLAETRRDSQRLVNKDFKMICNLLLFLSFCKTVHYMSWHYLQFGIA